MTQHNDTLSGSCWGLNQGNALLNANIQKFPVRNSRWSEQARVANDDFLWVPVFKL